MRLARPILAVFILASWACGGSSSSPTAPSTAGATLNVMLKDSPFGDAKALLVTFSSVSAHLSGGDFMPLAFASGATSRTCDLKKLTTAQDVLGTGPLPTGHYTELRLVVASASIYFDNASAGSPCAPTIAAPGGRSAAVDVPSGEVRLNREFDVTSTTATTMLLDFDGDQSVKDTGNGRYRMTPVISVVSVSGP
ncbi:MAG TPA: DUF4382 domain-containing protein [Vicinamibacterales bacterium]|nr:DUF4382 domain-containing protein [Vicinamibacterales bacterium]